MSRKSKNLLILNLKWVENRKIYSYESEYVKKTEKFTHVRKVVLKKTISLTYAENENSRIEKFLIQK